MGLTRYKKIFLGIGLLILVLVIGYVIFILFFQSTPQQTEGPEDQKATTTGELPEAERGQGQVVGPGEGEGMGTTPRGQVEDESGTGGQPGEEAPDTSTLSDSSTVGATLGQGGNGVQYYNEGDGKFYRVNEQGEAKALSDKKFHNVENVTWSPNKNKAVIEYPDGSNIVYNFDKEKQISLPQHWDDFNFSPTGEQMTFKSMGMDPDNRWLAISNDSGSQTRTLEKIGENADQVHTSWSPNQQIIGMHTEGESFDRQKVYFIGKNNENFQSMTVPGRGFEHKWSEKGDKLLYSVYSERNDLKPGLWTTSAEPGNIGKGRKSLDVNTWAHKCSFSNNNEAYCGVPQNLEEGDGLFRNSNNTNDKLYKINTKTGEKQLIADPAKGYSMNNLQVSEDGDKIYFTDQKTGKIHQMELK